MGARPGRTKTAVDRVGRGKEQQLNIRFLAMTNHSVFEPEICNPAAGWDRASEAPSVRARWRRDRSRRTCGTPPTRCFWGCFKSETLRR